MSLPLFQSVSGQKEVTEESLSPVQVDDKSAELQVKLMEEKWKRESVEIELEKQKDEFEKRVRKEVEKVKHAMKVQQQGDKNIEYGKLSRAKRAGLSQKKGPSCTRNGPQGCANKNQ